MTVDVLFTERKFEFNEILVAKDGIDLLKKPALKLSALLLGRASRINQANYKEKVLNETHDLFQLLTFLCEFLVKKREHAIYYSYHGLFTRLN